MLLSLRRWAPLVATPLMLLACIWHTTPAPAQNPAVINPSIAPGKRAQLSRPEKLGPRVELDLVTGPLEARVERVLAQMTLDEKIGQLCQIAVHSDTLPAEVVADLRAGRIGSLFYTGSAEQIRLAQEIAAGESRLGLPLLAPRDVIHGFRTVFPIPLGQAASWDPALIEQACGIAASEAKAEGINWTFAPMLDIARDARWGRIAESVGEDPVLASEIARSMVRGFQQETRGPDGERRIEGVAACAKHFAAYGLSEGGRDYNAVHIGVGELHSTFLAPFRAAVDAGCLTVMTGFSSVNGVPATGHRGLVRGVLKEDWGFDGLVVSDWGSIVEMIDHGFAANRREAAYKALRAGVDMEMATTTFQEHLRQLVDSGRVPVPLIDDAVRRVLRVKLLVALPRDSRPGPGARAGLANGLRPVGEAEKPSDSDARRRDVARRLARESVVMLKNDGATLPLEQKSLTRVAVIGPLADAARDQLGCWMLDGKPEEAVTVAAALREALAGDAEVDFVAGLASSTDLAEDAIPAAAAAAQRADVAVVCVGEGWHLSGEARCRVSLDLPGAQRALVHAVAATKTPVVLVVLAGRPLAIGAEAKAAGAVLYAWHPGTMGGPAIVDLLLGQASPSGKLPVTFPKSVGQVPLYYNHPNTGRPALPGTRALFESGLADFPEEQKYRSHYLDTDPFPLYPFGYGLSYASFEYGAPELSAPTLEPGRSLTVRTRLTNTGAVEADEVVQMYVQDVTARLVRPVRELKAFRRVRLAPGESTQVEFPLPAEALAYYDNNAVPVLEPGLFRVGVGGDSTAPLSAEFNLRRSGVALGDAAGAEARR